MTRSIRATIGAATLMALAAVAGAWIIDGTLDLSWNTIDGGGATFSTGGTLELGGTIGQPDAGITMSGAAAGGELSITGGFWAGASIPLPDTCPADIAPLPNGNGLVNIDDLLMVIGGWGACPLPCPPNCPADVTHNCTVNIDDLLTVIAAWGMCP